MNNRYLYRAKHVHAFDVNKKYDGWVYGYLSCENYIYSPEFEVEKLIDPNTICQCTGLKDKNGKLIWENDVLMGNGNPKDLVKAVFGDFYVIDVETLDKVDKVVGWHYEVIPTDAISKCEPFCIPMPLTDEYIERCEFEVIGNIFDNPELLEVGE